MRQLGPPLWSRGLKEATVTVKQYASKGEGCQRIPLNGINQYTPIITKPKRFFGAHNSQEYDQIR